MIVQDLHIISFELINKDDFTITLKANLNNGLNKTINIPCWYNDQIDQLKELKQEMLKLYPLGYYVEIDEETIINFFKTINSSYGKSKD